MLQANYPLLQFETYFLSVLLLQRISFTSYLHNPRLDMYMPNNATVLADHPSTTFATLTETAGLVIGLSKYLIFISGGLAILVASSFHTARAIVHLTKPRQARQQASREESVERQVNTELAVILVTAASYILALVASFMRHHEDGEDWPGVFLIAAGCVVGVLVGHLLCVLMIGLAARAWIIFELQLPSLDDSFEVPEIRKGRRSTTGVMRKYEV
ncbi:hypothetical protein LTR17_011977 [Elasticomyces elasticus]|nr:hypothetical protein LTR17_011977 [Elasticomyces elasticus]